MQSFRILDAIAKGVEARLVRSSIAKIVTLETINIAQKFHIPEKEIQEWYSSRCRRAEVPKDNRKFKKNLPELTHFAIKKNNIS